MNGEILTGINGQYLFFPDDDDTILSLGDFNSVYLGANAQTGKKVIVKKLNPNLVSNKLAEIRFLMEASINIDHPGVVKNIDYIKGKTERYFVQEYIHGISLNELIHNRVVLEKPSLISNITIKLLECLQVIHDNNIVHRDIKPSNIIVAFEEGSENINWKNPDVRIIDFGLCKTSDNIPLFSSNKRIHSFSLLYSAPEILLNKEGLISLKSDIYSVGLLMMEMFTGQPVFYSDNPAKLISIQLSNIPKQPKNMHNYFYEIIKKSSAKKKITSSTRDIPHNVLTTLIAEGISMRYNSATDMKNDIIDFLKNPGEKPEKGIKALKKLFKKS